MHDVTLTPRASTRRRSGARRAPLLRLAGLAVAALAAIAGNVRADNWWEGIQGTGTPDFSGRERTQRAAAKPDTMNDLRNGTVPFRSEEMVSFLDKAISQYQTIVNKGGWPAIPGNRMIRPGDDDERLPLLRRRLRVTGDLRGSNSGFEDYNFDGTTEEAVRRFQERHGLRASGRVDQPTLAALNITAT